MLPSVHFFIVLMSCLNGDIPLVKDWSHDAAVFSAAEGSLSRENLRKYFQNHKVNPEQRAEISSCLERLGDDDFQTRELASKTLRGFGQAAVPALQSGLASPDAEIRRRCKEGLQDLEEDALVAFAAVRLLAAFPNADSAPLLLDYLPNAGSRALEMEVLMSLASLPTDARPSTTDLEKLLTDKFAIRRSAAAILLAQSADERQHRLIVPLLDDPQPAVRLRAAQALLPHSSAKASATLLQLSTAPGPETATEASCLLTFAHGATQEEKSALRGLDLPLNAYVSSQLRLAVVQRETWQQQVQALREQEKMCSQETGLIAASEQFVRESARVAEVAEQTLRLWGVSRGALEKIKAE